MLPYCPYPKEHRSIVDRKMKRTKEYEPNEKMPKTITIQKGITKSRTETQRPMPAIYNAAENPQEKKMPRRKSMLRVTKSQFADCQTSCPRMAIGVHRLQTGRSYPMRYDVWSRRSCCPWPRPAAVDRRKVYARVSRGWSIPLVRETLLVRLAWMASS